MNNIDSGRRGKESPVALPVLADFALHAQVEASREILGEGEELDSTVELAENAHLFADRLIERAVSASSNERFPVCRQGCSACCHLHVAALAPEVIAIAEAVRQSFDQEQIRSLRVRIDDHIEATQGMSGDERRQTRLPCPLLVEHACSVYSARPLACRGWNSTDRSVCDEDLQNPRAKTAARLNLGQFTVAGRVAEGVAIACHERGADHRLLDLARGLKVALETPDIAASWRRADTVFDGAVIAALFPEELDPSTEEARKALWDSVRSRAGWSKALEAVDRSASPSSDIEVSRSTPSA